jgi:hypothetical protein
MNLFQSLHDVLNKDVAFAIVKLLEALQGTDLKQITEHKVVDLQLQITGLPLCVPKSNPLVSWNFTQNKSDGWFMGIWF